MTGEMLFFAEFCDMIWLRKRALEKLYIRRMEDSNGLSKAGKRNFGKGWR